MPLFRPPIGVTSVGDATTLNGKQEGTLSVGSAINATNATNAVSATNASNSDTLDTKHYSDLQSEFATIDHSHVIDDITDLDTNDFATTDHTHSIYAPLASGVTNGNSHDHSGGDGNQISYTTLSNVPTTFTPTSHNHAISDVTNISSTFATIDHNHVIADVTDLDTSDFATVDHIHTNATSVVSGFLPILDNSGTKYLRDDGTWQTISAGISDAPIDALLYGRQDGNWAEVTLPDMSNYLTYYWGIYKNDNSSIYQGTTTFNTDFRVRSGYYVGSTETLYVLSSINLIEDHIEIIDNNTDFATITATNITLNGNDVWHEGNDGSGSGLDADLLDGHEASEFATVGLTGTASTSFKINNTDDWGATAVEDGSTLSVINMPYVKISYGNNDTSFYTINTGEWGSDTYLVSDRSGIETYVSDDFLYYECGSPNGGKIYQEIDNGNVALAYYSTKTVLFDAYTKGDSNIKRGIKMEFASGAVPIVTVYNNTSSEFATITPTAITINNCTVPKYHGSLASAPTSPVAGDEYYNSGDSKFYKYNGSSWIALN